jgi:stage II sporulation protein P
MKHSTKFAAAAAAFMLVCGTLSQLPSVKKIIDGLSTVALYAQTTGNVTNLPAPPDLQGEEAARSETNDNQPTIPALAANGQGQTPAVFELHTPDDIVPFMNEARAALSTKTKAGSIFSRTSTGGSGYLGGDGGLWFKDSTNSKTLDASVLKNAKADFTITDISKPSILIYHTHTTECYEILDLDWFSTDYITRTNNKELNMVRIGEEIAERLRAAGFNVLHDTEIHDTKYTGSYDHSRAAIQKYLKEYPTLQVLLDVHRDSMTAENGDRYKPVATVANRKVAQIMFLCGTIAPEWQKNLDFASEMQMAIKAEYPELMRPILLKGGRYNQDLSPVSMLVEVGTDANTIEEALLSAQLFGGSLGQMLLSHTKS